jgi:hypothetical protein
MKFDLYWASSGHDDEKVDIDSLQDLVDLQKRVSDDKRPRPSLIIDFDSPEPCITVYDDYME